MSGDIVVERRGRLGTVRLARPKAMNALTLPMVRWIARALDEFAVDPAVSVVLLEGEGDRAFCAGGDIRAIHDSAKAGEDMPAVFWAEEYELNASIARFEKPVVVFMHGIVMGGGAGLSIHARHRVVTDTTRFAMPEVGIGFVPDVGSTFRLARAPDHFGRFLALTGATVGPADTIAAGLADAMVPAARLAALREALGDATDGEAVAAAIARERSEPEPGLHASEGKLIARAFSEPTVDEILESLESIGGGFADETRTTIVSRSPRSLRDADTLLALAARSPSLEDCLQREFWAALVTLRRPDFFEGVRAAVIDKDRSPRWEPSTLAAVPQTTPAAFAPVPGIRPPFSREKIQ